MWHLPSSTLYRRWMELMVPPLISPCKVFYFCYYSQSSGLDVFMTQLDVNVSFPCSATAFSPLLPPRNSTLIHCLYLSLSTSWLYDTHTEQQAEGSEQKTALCLAESTKVGTKHHGHTEVLPSTSHLPSPTAAGTSQQGRGSSLFPLP